MRHYIAYLVCAGMAGYIGWLHMELREVLGPAKHTRGVFGSPMATSPQMVIYNTEDNETTIVMTLSCYRDEYEVDCTELTSGKARRLRHSGGAE